VHPKDARPHPIAERFIRRNRDCVRAAPSPAASLVRLTRETVMWKETAIRLFIGIGGMLVGALFVLMLNGAALAGAERLHVAKARADATAAATAGSGTEEIAALATPDAGQPGRAR
jgi:hypothetical protein